MRADFFFPSAALSVTFLLHLPCPVPWKLAYMNCLLQYPLSSGFLHLVAEAQQEVRKRMRERGLFPLAGSSQAVAGQWVVSIPVSPVAVTMHGFWELPSAFTS